MTTQTAPGTARSLNEVPGWFRAIDQDLFRVLLDATATEPGDLLEMGCYLGKSAILLGEHLRAEETFTVCDLFGVESHGLYSRRDTLAFYRQTLTRAAFEANYLAFHENLPVIVHGRTTALASRIERDSCRFVHIDASRTYEDMSGDIDIARSVLRKHGIVAIDDYRTEHVPGVAAAAWEAVFTKGLRPVCLSAAKLYATWGDPEPFQRAVRSWAADRVDRVVADEKIDGDPVIRVINAIPGPRGARRLALELLPPVVSRALVRPKTGR
ncbi:class I SAM-dependent methyltransferase [Streptomyces himalayensis]|uniref:Class I SAM-dependent methyltransferase n=1 Tax=Streptomyces himalayensis subsp. himalayensis TaxID=2756131 RepID=A0A7W0DQS2_9ACTN|nr:class I SAM-dependent methyltransferase [Streptomyces himalayensis]MBA2949537.1 class I SAM-dependent methyltransferase [Streptomyces himalayensis subsp. himalayensis]